MTLAISQAFALPMEGNTPNVLSFGFDNPTGAIDRLTDMPVGYRYRYLTGGLGADDWRHWNSPDGSFVDRWLNESREAGLVPVLSYYEIVHAEPNPGEEPPLQNLQVPATMKIYFENWIFLMQRIAVFGHPVIVQLEPDLFANIQWNNSDPAFTPVAVASSGLPQAAGYENNARGFTQLIVALRDRYAPKVILGWHASTWATRTDLILNQGDPDELALATAKFYQVLKAPFDVMFTGFSDRDSGYYQTQGKAKHWWQQEDFDRFRQFIVSLSNELKQDVIIWQIPQGNTLYRSSNNTVGHYQDNRPEYLLQPLLDRGDTSHLQQFRDAGVVAFLFGSGQKGQTEYFDARNDGMTNPEPIDNRQYNHTDRLNDRVALNADDDGGFLRHAIKRYYADGALPLNRLPAVCNDGRNNDSDGKVDYPVDAGCSSTTDSDEADTQPTSLVTRLSITKDWTSGYCANVTVENTAAKEQVWQVSIAIEGKVNSLWDAVYSQNGTILSASGVKWNKSVAAGQSRDFGFCATR